jgi:hypothetical protein
MKAVWIGFAAVGLSGVVHAQVDVSGAWVRGTVSGQTTTGAYMELKSVQGAVLVGAESPIARRVEIHEMKMDGDVMRMRAMPRLPIPAGKPVALRPGGVHVMLTGLKRPLSKGERIPLKLKIETPDKKLATVDVEAEVRELGSGAPAAAPGGHGSH